MDDLQEALSTLAAEVNAGCTCSRAGFCPFCQRASLVRIAGLHIGAAEREIEQLRADLNQARHAAEMLRDNFDFEVRAGQPKTRLAWEQATEQNAHG